MKISLARLAAYEILLRIERERAFSSVLLPQYEEQANGIDRPLIHALTLGVLRRKLYLDKLIETLSGKRVGRLDLEVLIALRIGLFQMRFLDKIPASAAVNESVNLVQFAKKTSARGFVNAVLRKATREFPDPLRGIDDELERIAIETSHPKWLLEKWTRDRGLTDAAALASANNETPSLVFRVVHNTDAGLAEILKKTGLEITASEIVPHAWRVVGVNEILRSYVETGKIYFQEESSQLVASIVKLNAGERFFDVCAAPGSKTTYIARESETAGGNFTVAGDLYFHRLGILKEATRRMGFGRINLIEYDAEKEVPFVEGAFDCILIDAPCSGTGTIRHNPEIRYSISEEDFKALANKQLAILKNASKTLKQGGRLIYSTCSIEPEENELVIEKFLAETSGFVKTDFDVPERFLTNENFARTFPHRDGTDGFFFAMLKRL